MHDNRFDDCSILNRRSYEWTYTKIENSIHDIFSCINVLDGWKFVKTEWVNEKPKKKEELRKSVFKTLKIYVDELSKKGETKKEHIYSIQIPDLIYNQFFYIGGLLKVPIFQLYDDPIIHRKTKKGRILKFKNNCLSLLVTFNNKKKNMVAYLHTKHMSTVKGIPFELLIAAMYTKNELKTFLEPLGYGKLFDIPESEDEKFKANNEEQTFIMNLINSCIELWSKNTSNELIEKLGDYRTSASNVDRAKKGNSILFAIKKAIDVDIFTKRFMKTNSVIFELLKSLDGGHSSDNDLKNKRIRFSEYIMSDLVSTVYDMICTLNYSSKTRFKISQSIIMDPCNLSDIVHFNFNYNPTGEIASFLQCSLTGPGGFKKESVPVHLRNIDESHFGRICPADTPDRDGCGVVLNMVPGVKLEENGKFSEEISPIPCSYTINYTPFVQNNDQTRLQMASSQTKQSLMLVNPEKPFVKSGVENKYLEYTTFKHVARFDGKVIHKDNKFILVQYKNDLVDSFRLGYRDMYLNSADYIDTTLKEGDVIKENDVICESRFIRENDVTFGHNLLTAICIWDGYNYEDGIVISESTAEKLTSIHTMDLSFEIESGQVLLSLLDDKYLPLPKVGDKLSRGDVYAKIKHIIGEDGFESINLDPTELIVTEDCEITDIEVYANTWNKQIPQFDHFIKNIIEKQNNTIKDIREKLEGTMDKADIDKFLILNELSQYEIAENAASTHYVEKGSKINGVFVKVKAIYKEKMGIGDKMSNRHAAKGVIAKIIPDDQMLKTPDGRIIDIIMNPLSIISRMNVGQLYELHSTEALYHLRNRMLHTLENETKNVQTLEKDLRGFLDILDKTKTKWVTNTIINKFRDDCKIDKIQAIKNIQIIQPPFQSINPKDLQELLKYTGAKYRYKLTCPDKTKDLEGKIVTGYVYYEKLVHRASDKMMGRSIGIYNKNTLQPVGGKKRMGGHRLGEGEIWALGAAGAKNMIKEFLTTYSDSPGKKNKLLATVLNNPELAMSEQQDEKPQSFRMFESYLKVLGLDLKE